MAKNHYGRRRWCRHHVFTGGTAPIAAIFSPMPANYIAHDHDFLEIAIVAEGTGFHRSAHGKRPMKPGDVFILRPGAWHAYDDCKGLVLYNCCLGEELLQRELAWLSDDPVLNRLFWTGPMSPDHKGVVAIHLPPSAFHPVARCWRRLNRVCRGPANGSLGRMSALISLLERLSAGAREEIRKVFPTGQRTHPIVAGVMRAMEQDLKRNWTLARLTASSRINPAYLIRLFKAHTGLPPIGYLARCRAERAAMLLSGTTLPVKEVAEEVGWPDQNYFARRFKALLGLSPTAYRQHLSRMDPAAISRAAVVSEGSTAGTRS